MSTAQNAARSPAAPVRMSISRGAVIVLALLWGSSLAACAHCSLDQGGGGGLNSAQMRIDALIAQGDFAQADVLIEDSVSSGVLDESAAAALRRKSAELSMKLTEIPARLQRVANFPARLKEFTRQQIEKMYEADDFSVASKKELQTALKLLKDVAKDNPRLLQKF